MYDLSDDPAEKKNLAGNYPEIVDQAAGYMKKAWVEDPNFPQTLLVKSQDKK